jgi:hypothetical protein
MKKLIAIGVIILFIGLAFAPSINANLGNIQTDELSNNKSLIIINDQIIKNQRDQIFETSICISSPEITKSRNNIKISLEEGTSQTLTPNKPMLPVITSVYILPFKSKIKDLNIYFDKKQVIKITEPINFAPEPIPTAHKNIDERPIQYEKSDLELYPEKRYEYYVNSVRYNDEIVNYLTLRIYPIQHDPINNTINFLN